MSVRDEVTKGFGRRRSGAGLRLLLMLAASAVLLLPAACGDSAVPTGDDPEDPSNPPPADPPPGGALAAASITESDLAGRVGLLADDSMRGRATPSPELEKAARYAAAEFARFGLEPEGGDGYLQWFAPTLGEPVDAMNVIGRLPGSDPALRAEHLVIAAHFDHLGMGLPVSGDSIYNGADDNASGTAAVLELAEAFASLDTPPRRSILFVLFSAEERGLLGSAHYANDPAVSMDATAAMLNLDMLGRNWTDRVAAIYPTASDIFRRADAVTDLHPELGMTLVDNPWPEENLLFRSDQYHFVRFGVPVLFLTSGLHGDYHRPSDEPDTLDYEKEARLVRLAFWIGWELAEAAQPPS